MKLTINYLIDKQGQLDAAARGVPAAEQQQIVVEITEPDDIRFFGGLPDADINDAGDTITVKLTGIWWRGWHINRFAGYQYERGEIKPTQIHPHTFSFVYNLDEMVNWLQCRERQHDELKAELPRLQAEEEAAREQERFEEEMRRAERVRGAAEIEARAARLRSEREEQRRRELDEAAEWIREHGSERLRLALDEGLLDKIRTPYLEERLAVEHPGWQFYNDLPGGIYDILNPSLETLRWFRANKIDGAKLQYYKDPHECDEDCYGEDCPEYDQECPCITATWRDHKIILLMDSADQVEADEEQNASTENDPESFYIGTEDDTL